uniref:Uncharacterized protein n=1 Tax=Glossina pallidipes TaxID=7398 RepID=A0A1A9ZIQ7_GLOPL
MLRKFCGCNCLYLGSHTQRTRKAYRVEICDISLAFAIRNYEFMHMQGYTTRHRMEAYITRDVLQAIVWSLISFYIFKPNNIVKECVVHVLLIASSKSFCSHLRVFPACHLFFTPLTVIY